MARVPAGVAFGALAVALAAAVAAALSFGAVRIPWSELPGLVVSMPADDSSDLNALVFHQLRLPRAALAILVGATLSVAGAMMQGLFRNPLADPGLIGVSSGAALGAVGVIVFGGTLGLDSIVGEGALIPLAALGGSWFVTVIILKLGSHGGRTSVATLLLAGIAVNALSGAFIGMAVFFATDVQLRSLNFWMLGSLGAASWRTVLAALPFCAVLLIGARWTCRPLNALSLGEGEAGHLGFRPQSVKTVVILLTSAGVGGCVAQTGMIGFVGLVIPHLLRLMIGPDHRWVIPGSALLGATLTLVADTLCRTAVAPAELPIGVVTAAVGAPFFLLLLWQQRKRVSWI